MCNFWQIFISYLILLLIAVPRALLRATLLLSLKCGCGSVQELVDLRSVPNCGWDYSKTPVNTVLITIQLNGKHGPDSMKRKVEAMVKQHTRFTCFTSTCLTIPCWRKDTNWQIDHHLFYKTLDSKRGLQELQENLLSSPFPINRSPWVIYAVNLKDEETCFLLLKINHALCDGHSLLQLLKEEIVDDESDSQIPTNFTPGESRRIGVLEKVKALHSAIAKFSKIAEPDYGYQSDPTKVYVVEPLQGVPLSIIREGKKLLGVSFHAFTLTALQDAVISFLKKKGRNEDEVWPCAYALPSPFRNERRDKAKLQNDLSLVILPIQPGGRTGDVEGTERFFLQEKLDALEGYISFPILGLLPLWIIKKACKLSVPIGFSDLPVSSQKLRIEGKTCTRFCFNFNYFQGSGGIRCGALSYAGVWFPTVAVSQALFASRQEAQEFVEDFVQNIYKLHQAGLMRFQKSENEITQND